MIIINNMLYRCHSSIVWRGGLVPDLCIRHPVVYGRSAVADDAGHYLLQHQLRHDIRFPAAPRCGEHWR